MEADRDIKLKDLYSHETENHTTVHHCERDGGVWDDDRLSYVTTIDDDHPSYFLTVDDDHFSYFLTVYDDHPSCFLTVDDNKLLFKPMAVSRDLVPPNIVEGGAGSVDG
jgi:hypothetical protein